MRDYDINNEVVRDSAILDSYQVSKEEKEYIRPRMDYLRDYEISIKFLSLGCLVRVGCKEIAFRSIEEAMNEINAYVANPRISTDRYNRLFNEEK